jgi:Domain of unknown function (DUF4136)
MTVKDMKAALLRNLLLGIAIVVAACSPVTIVSTEPASGFALANYKTFDFFKTESSGEISPKFDERLALLKTELSKQLTARGLSQTSSEAELLINIGVVIEEKVQTRETDFRTDAHYMGQRNYSWQAETVEVGRYHEGTVTVHLVDRVKNAMVWRGVVNGFISEKDSKVQETIAAGAEALIKKIK